MGKDNILLNLKREILPHATTWKKLEDSVPKASHRKRNTLHKLTYMRYLKTSIKLTATERMVIRHQWEKEMGTADSVIKMNKF